MPTSLLIAFFGGIGPLEMVVIGTVAVLLFGSRLPSVARSAGKSLTEFRRGMQDLQSDFRQSIDMEETLKYSPPSDTVHQANDHEDDEAEEDPSEDSPESDEQLEGYPPPQSPVI